jgi:hypothetical protein
VAWELEGGAAAAAVMRDLRGSGPGPGTPGRRTRTELADTAEAAAAAEAAAGAAEAAARRAAIAARGVEGAGEALPFQAQIQRSFGRFDVSRVRAHIGGRAAEAARALGGRAYAHRGHVAFVDDPDLHTAAHEAAHVVQQGAGAAPGAGIDEPGDAYEQHADAVAALVVRGESAEVLLARLWGGAGSAARAVVQRQTAPSPAAPPAPAPAPPAPAPPAPAPPLPPSRTATWRDVAAAATDAAAAARLDIDWIDRLPEHLRHAIDVEFAQDRADATLQRKLAADAVLRQLAAERAAQRQALVRETAKRLGVPPGSPQIAQDPGFAAAAAAIDAAWRSARAAREAALRTAHDAAVPAGRRSQSVTEPDAAKIQRAEGQALARTNFMSWAIHVTGSADAAKRHFQSVRQVERAPGMWLARAAAQRFEAARAAFEAAHPGYTFPRTTVAQGARGLHQTRQGVGMLGHILGLSFDLEPYDNPNLKGPEGEAPGLNAYMLKQHGADPQTGKPGRAQLDLQGVGGDGRIEAMGQRTIAGRSTPEDAAALDVIREQYEAMAATSARFRASLAPHMAKLRDARAQWLALPELKAQRAAATAKMKRVDQLARAQLAEAERAEAQRAKAQRAAAPVKLTGEARAQRLAELTAELTKALEKERDTLDERAKTSELRIARALHNAFTPWRATAHDQIQRAGAQQAASDQAVKALAEQQQQLAALSAVSDLEAFAARNQLSGAAASRPQSGRAYKVQLARELAAKRAEAAQRAAYAAREQRAVEAFVKRLDDRSRIFGAGVKQRDGGWAPRREVAALPVMQYLELGFARNDPMPAVPLLGVTRTNLKAVFNTEVVVTLARFGWSPGATFGDTMHFDFIEGYTATVPGGRSGANMKRTRFSPEGDYAPPGAQRPPGRGGQ